MITYRNDRIVTKVLRICIIIYTPLKSECFSAGTELTLYRALIASIMTHVCFPAWEFAVDSYLLKLQRLQNEVLPIIVNLPRSTTVRNLDVAFRIPYLYHLVTKLCRQPATVTLNNENVNIRNICQSEAQHRKYKRLKLGGGQAYSRSIV
jgi:hypothetical protein